MNTSTSEIDLTTIADDTLSQIAKDNPPKSSPLDETLLLCKDRVQSTPSAQITATEKLANVALSEIYDGNIKVKKTRLKLKKIMSIICFPVKLFLNAFSFIFTFAMKLIELVDGFIFPANFLEISSLSSLRASKKFMKYILILIGISILLVHSSKKIDQHAFKVQRFFTGFSLVKDFYSGELDLLNEALLLSDYTFVLYYAPWDRQSQDIKSHFLKVASYHHEQITFAAINCWLPKAKCQAHYKLREYPLLVLHIRLPSNEDTLNIPYNGPLNSHHMTRFLTTSLRPLSHVASREDLIAMKLRSKAVVAGHFDRNLSSADFLAFYYSSLIRLQFEETKDVSFGVITDPLVADSLFDTKAVLHLMLWNVTLIYPEDSISSFKNITEWLNKNIRDLLAWVPLEGRKSFSLSDSLKKGAVLLLIVPENPYYDINNYLLMLKSVALEYFSCKPIKSTFAKSILSAIRDQTSESEIICKDFLKDQILYHSTLMQTLEDKDNTQEPFCKMPQTNYLCATPNTPLIEAWDSLFHSLDVLPFFSLNRWTKEYTDSCACKGDSCNKNITLFCKGSIDAESPKIKYLMQSGPVEDERIAMMKESVSEEHCKKLYFSKMFPHSFVQDSPGNISISGLGCQSNKTLTFLAMNSVMDQSYAENLGINLSLPLNSTGAVIIDPEAEEYYRLEKPLSRISLAAFILNYTNSLLDRSYISHEAATDGSHCDSDESCIEELTAANYVASTERAQEAYVVLHYSSSCGACSAIAPTFLLCASLASNVTSLTFARIDVSSNVLPWHLTFSHLPTIIFHPSRRKSETQVFDSRTPITYENLMQFVLSNLNKEGRRKLASDLCDSKCQSFFLSSGMHVYAYLRQRFAFLFSTLKGSLHQLDAMRETQGAQIRSTYKNHHLTLERSVRSVVIRICSIRLKMKRLKYLYTFFEDDIPNYLAFNRYLLSSQL